MEDPIEPLTDLDPFDLPDWLGTDEVVWRGAGLACAGERLEGLLTGAEPGESLPCDLLAVDVAYPRPVVDEATRTRAHQAWRNGESLLVRAGGRPTLLVPGTGFSADLVLDALGRLARAVGASEDHYAATITVGRRPRLGG